MKRWALIALLAFAAAACSDKKQTEVDDETAETEAAEDAAAAEEDEDAGGEEAEIPTPEEFEEEAEGAITEDSLEAEVEALEEELGADEE